MPTTEIQDFPRILIGWFCLHLYKYLEKQNQNWIPIPNLIVDSLIVDHVNVKPKVHVIS